MSEAVHSAQFRCLREVEGTVPCTGMHSCIADCLAIMGAAGHQHSLSHTWTPSSRCIFFRLGKVVDSSCRTMDALMYGTMPARPGCAG